MQRRQRPVQYVVDAIEMPRLFDCSDVGWFLEHADQLLVAGWTGAIDTGIDVGDVVADRTQAQIGFDIANCGRKRFSVVFARAQNMKRQTLGALAADARQLLELIDEPGHRLRKFGHR